MTKNRKTPSTPKPHNPLKGGAVKGSDEDRAPPKQCNEYPKKKSNP